MTSNINVHFNHNIEHIMVSA